MHILWPGLENWSEKLRFLGFKKPKMLKTFILRFLGVLFGSEIYYILHFISYFNSDF